MGCKKWMSRRSIQVRPGAVDDHAMKCRSGGAKCRKSARTAPGNAAVNGAQAPSLLKRQSTRRLKADIALRRQSTVNPGDGRLALVSACGDVGQN